MKKLFIGYLNYPYKKFISSIVNEGNFLNILSKYVKVKVFNVSHLNLPDFLQSRSDINKVDYLIIDIKHFSCLPFLWREQGKLNTPFIIILRTVYEWLQPLVFICPLLRKDDIIIAPSKYAQQSFLKITEEFNVYHIPHCLDILKIHNLIKENKTSSSSPHEKIITFLGRIVPEKGVEYLIFNFKAIIKEINNLKLYIIGPLSGEDIGDNYNSYYVRRLKVFIKKTRLASNIEFKGMQLGLNKYKLLKKSTVFINPSLNPVETFSFSNLEALACGVPVIATKIGAFKEMIKNGYNGYLLDIKLEDIKLKIDNKKMIYLIKKIIYNENVHRKLSNNAKITSLRYDYRKIMPNLLKLLKKKQNYYNTKRWNNIKDKRIIDFSNIYTKDMFFFIVSLGWGNLTYQQIHDIVTRNQRIKTTIRCNKIYRFEKIIEKELLYYFI